jgi:hypothetical protein
VGTTNRCTNRVGTMALVLALEVQKRWQKTKRARLGSPLLRIETFGLVYEVGRLRYSWMIFPFCSSDWFAASNTRTTRNPA